MSEKVLMQRDKTMPLYTYLYLPNFKQNLCW